MSQPRDTSGPGQALEFEIWSDLIKQSQGALHVFLPLLDRGVDAVLHAATLHKPHVATHSRQDFVDTNITGTLNLLEEAAAAGGSLRGGAVVSRISSAVSGQRSSG